LTELPRGDPVRFLDGKPASFKLRIPCADSGECAPETKNAVAATSDLLTLATLVREGEWLDVAMVVTCSPAGSKCEGTFAFRVVAEITGGSSRPLMDEPVRAGSGWHQRRIALTDLAGREARFLFTAEPVASPGPPSSPGSVASPAGDAAASAVAAWGEPLLRRERQDRPFNVVLVSIDTLRADRLGSYGYDKDTSPNLDALARQGVRFDQAISQAPWTIPSHMSMLTALHPSSHKVTFNGAALRGLPILPRGNGKESSAVHANGELRGGYRRLPDDVITLAEVLQESGFSTAAAVGGGNTSGRLGFDQGFDQYLELNELDPQTRWQAMRQMLEDLRSTPFFLFLHTYDVHAPYIHTQYARPLLTDEQFEALNQSAHKPPDLSASQFKKSFDDYLRTSGLMRKEITSALYDGGIRYVDESLIGALVTELKRLGIYDRTLILVTSDHGEEFGEHDPKRFYDAHCTNLYDSLIRVPLILRMPGRFASGQVVGEQVRLIDIPPTILELLALDVPNAMEGTSLVRVMEGIHDAGPRWAISEATCSGPEWKSIRSLERKYMMSLFAPGAWWEVDLGEQIDIETIRIWNRTDCCAVRLSRYWVLVSDHPDAAPGEAGTFAHLEMDPAGSPSQIAVGASGRYVRVQLSGNGLLSLAEVEVLQRSARGLTNVALGKTATQSSTANRGVASRAVDGNTSGRYPDGSVTHTEWHTPAVDRTGIQGAVEVEDLFDPTTDPTEQRSILGSERRIAEGLRDTLVGDLEKFATKNSTQSVPINLSEDTLERLRALGYIE
jgi:arylsulfatase A-like enzyme